MRRRGLYCCFPGRVTCLFLCEACTVWVRGIVVCTVIIVYPRFPPPVPPSPYSCPRTGGDVGRTKPRRLRRHATRARLHPPPCRPPCLFPFLHRTSQLLPVLRPWLEPAADDRAFLSPPQRASLLKVLMALPVQKSHLKESGLGKLAVAMAADPEETGDNRELIKQVSRKEG